MVNPINYEHYLNVKRHQKKTGTSKFRCVFCNLEIDNQSNLIKHLSEKKHENKINIVEKEMIKSIEFPTEGSTMMMEGFNNDTIYEDIKETLNSSFF